MSCKVMVSICKEGGGENGGNGAEDVGTSKKGACVKMYVMYEEVCSIYMQRRQRGTSAGGECRAQVDRRG